MSKIIEGKYIYFLKDLISIRKFFEEKYTQSPPLLLLRTPTVQFNWPVIIPLVFRRFLVDS